jgi:hypothetical protein
VVGKAVAHRTDLHVSTLDAPNPELAPRSTPQFCTARSSCSQPITLADLEAIEVECRHAAEHGLGWLDPGESLTLHTGMVERLPPLLRVNVGGAAVRYGD